MAVAMCPIVRQLMNTPEMSRSAVALSPSTFTVTPRLRSNVARFASFCLAWDECGYLWSLFWCDWERVKNINQTNKMRGWTIQLVLHALFIILAVSPARHGSSFCIRCVVRRLRWIELWPCFHPHRSFLLNVQYRLCFTSWEKFQLCFIAKMCLLCMP